MFTHKDLIPIAYKWVLKNGSCGVAFKELNTAGGEYADVIGFGSRHSILIEVKVSRSDFLADKKKWFRIHPEKGMGKERYYCCPTGLIRKDELPEGWGLIYVNQQGRATLVHRPLQEYSIEAHGRTYKMNRTYQHERNVDAEHALMYSALRRLHIKGHIECIYDKEYNYNHKE